MRVISLAAVLAAVAAEAVTVLTPDNFDSLVGKDKGAFVKFYAPWCGHCKNMAPEYEVVAETFKGAPVVVGKFDADAHKDFAGRFDVKGFPTLKWFPAGSSEGEAYSGGRSADDIAAFINSKLGTNKRIAKPASAVLDLDPSTFNAIVGDKTKHKLVEFFAPWCGHCKSLAPTYEKVAAAFDGEANVVVAKVDADKHRSLGERFGVTGFPTIKYFPAASSPDADYDLEDIVEDYNGGRDGDSFVTFLNEKAGTERTLAGGLLPTAGRVPELDTLAAKFAAAGADLAAVLAETEAAVAALPEGAKTKGKHYVNTMKKGVEKGAAWIGKEAARLDGMLAGGSINKAKRGDMETRRNVLKAFTA